MTPTFEPFTTWAAVLNAVSSFGGRCSSLSLAEMKAYLRGVADGAGHP